VHAPGARLAVESRPGVATGVLEAERDVVITAAVDDVRSSATVQIVATPRPSPVAPPAPIPAGAARWELGASVGPRYSGPFVGGALVLEGRWRVGRSRVHLGFNVAGEYTTGSTEGGDFRLGGGAASAVVEVRFNLSERVALVLGGAFGGVITGEHRTGSTGAGREVTDGGPLLGGTASAIARVGPGVFTIACGYTWAPLVEASLANFEGLGLAVGYRYARW
jgi:hypothetical protein